MSLAGGRPPRWGQGAPPVGFGVVAPPVIGRAPVPTALPVVVRQYQEFWRTPRWRWGRTMLALLLGGFVTLALMGLLPAIPLLYGAFALGDAAPRTMQDLVVTPAVFIVNNIAVALAAPVCMLVAWWLIGQRPRWLSSVAGGFRWRWALTCLAVILPVWLAYLGVDALLVGNPFDGWAVGRNTAITITGIVLTTPLQCAGEEYLTRGFLTRGVASYLASRRAGLIAGWLVSATVFMLLHGAGDPWLNVFYFSFATTASYLTWRTGGLEAAIVLHVVNNVLSEASMPFTDYSRMFDRATGVGSPLGLAVLPAFLLVAAGVEWLARRRPLLLRANDPGAREVEPAAFPAPGPSLVA